MIQNGALFTILFYRDQYTLHGHNFKPGLQIFQDGIFQDECICFLLSQY